MEKEGKFIDKRIEDLSQGILELASGNFDVKIKPSEKQDKIDAVIMGVNMLGEELISNTVTRDYLASIYKGVVDMLIILNPDNSIQDINSTTCELLGYERDELFGKPFEMLIPKESRQRMELILKDIIANSYCYNIEDVLFTKDEKELPVSFSASVLNDSKGRIQGIMYIIKDITSIKNSEELLRRKIQDLNTFVYKASHELKGPLDSIMGLANLAKREVKGTNVEQHIDYIIDMTQRLNTNLINLLQISQVTQGKIEMKEIDIEALVNDVLRSVEHIKGFNSVKVEVKVNLESSVVSDFRMLTSIFQNLLENGIKYQRDDIDDSFIKVIIRDDENSYFIEVADNGIGLEDHEQELIFDMFYRSDNIVESIEGTGLGMYIVKESVQKLKGGIKISSEINHGTSFDIVIPKEAILMKV